MHMRTTANGSFAVTVQDTTPPAIDPPGDIRSKPHPAAQRSPWADRHRLVDGSVGHLPARFTFALGTTPVHCIPAIRAATAATFNVTVLDTTAGT